MKAKRTKYPVFLRARWSGRHLRLSPLGADLSLPPLLRSSAHARAACGRSVVKVILSVSKPHTTRILVFIGDHQFRIPFSRARGRFPRFVRRLGRRVYLVDQHSNRRDYVANYGTITMLSRRDATHLFIRPRYS